MNKDIMKINLMELVNYVIIVALSAKKVEIKIIAYLVITLYLIIVVIKHSYLQPKNAKVRVIDIMGMVITQTQLMVIVNLAIQVVLLAV